MSCNKINKSFIRLHRERHQPESRKHLGYLEKKKDYKKRANDFQNKRKIIKNLKEKAFNKNQDEFHFHMVKSKIINGKHIDFRNDDDEFTPEQLKLMLTQDLSYVRFKLSIEQKKIDKLNSTLHLIDLENKPKNNHKIFVDNKEEVEKILKNNYLLGENLDNLNSFEMPNIEFLENNDLPDLDEQSLKNAIENKNKKYKELVTRLNRVKQLKIVYDKMLLKKQLAQEKDALKIKDGTKLNAPVYQFKMKRKK